MFGSDGPNAHFGSLDLVPGVAPPSGTVTNAMLANMPPRTIKGNDTAGTAAPQDLTVPEVQTLITIAVATPAALAALAVAGIPNGQEAFVSALATGQGPRIYVLQPLVSAAPDSLMVIPTADDATRQWVWLPIAEKSNFVYLTDELDLTAPQTVQIIPRLNYGSVVISLNPAWVITDRDGTVTTGPTAQMGTDAGITDYVPSTAQVGLAGVPAIGSRISPNGLTTVVLGEKNLTANGVRLQITVGAVLGTATVYRGRMMGGLMTYSL